MMQLEELGKLKKFKDVIRTRTRDLPACSIEPQLPTLPRTLSFQVTWIKYVNNSKSYLKMNSVMSLTMWALVHSIINKQADCHFSFLSFSIPNKNQGKSILRYAHNVLQEPIIMPHDITYLLHNQSTSFCRWSDIALLFLPQKLVLLHLYLMGN
jgi:hypothetical protein